VRSERKTNAKDAEDAKGRHGYHSEPLRPLRPLRSLFRFSSDDESQFLYATFPWSLISLGVDPGEVQKNFRGRILRFYLPWRNGLCRSRRSHADTNSLRSLKLPR